MTATLEAVAQTPQPGDLIQLFKLDATRQGGGVEYFVLASDAADAVTWQGQVYAPVPIVATGFDSAANGTLPMPKLKVLNINGALTGLIRDYGDLLGAAVTRTRTFRRFLDGEADANPNEHFPIDIYRVERKSALTKLYVEWELSCVLDQQGAMLPARQALRDYCHKRYRFWNGAAFDYSAATCPYSGAGCYDSVGSPVAQAMDACGKRLSDCRLRFGNNAVLPYGGFPGMTRYRG